MSTLATNAACHTSWPRCSVTTRGGRDACGAPDGRHQPDSDHHLRDPRHTYAGARHDHRQRRPALYAGQHRGEPGPDRLGADLLYRRCRHHDAADRLPRQPVRAQAPLPRLRLRLHRRLDAVRHVAILGANRALSNPSRLVRCGARAALADRAAQHQSAGAAGLCNGAMGRRCDGRSRSWAGARRLADRAYRWRYFFYINLPIGVLAFLGITTFLPEAERNDTAKLDWLGFGT